MRSPLMVITSAQEQAYAYLRDRIISGQFPAGMRLKSEELARKLEVSRIPIREALRQLHAEGLVEIKRNHGASVVTLSPADIMEMFWMRSVLEGLACRVASSKIDKKQIRALEEMLSKMQSWGDGPTNWITRHDKFHDYLCNVSGMRRLSQQAMLLRNQTHPYIRLYVSNHPDPEPLGLEHRALLEQILDGDADQAEAAMRGHIVENGKSIVAYLETQPSRGLVSHNLGDRLRVV
jgi:DNA-binding GntR family transcriptional regulator